MPNTDEDDARDDVLARALAWHDEGLGVALATVIGTWGSAPRRPGSHMAVNERGEFVGSVSGGCVEGSVIQASREVIDGGESRVLDFGVTNERAWEVGLACGGEMKVFLERLE